MRGSGKNTIGKLLADKLEKNYIDMDQLLVLQEKMPIKDFVNKSGWNKFREIESNLMKDLAKTKTNEVIATGGGVVENGQNIIQFKNKKDVIVWLKCSIETIISRIGDKTNIPLLTDADDFEQDLRRVYKERLPLYEKFADVTVSSEDNPESVATNIISKLKEKGYL